MYAKWWAAALVLTAACTKKNPGHCASDTDCSGATPFCDVDGAYDESDHTPNTCTVVPADCPLERCGCTPGTAVSCDGDQLATCAADGMSTTVTTCALGCSDAGHCTMFTPSNGLAGALGEAVDSQNVALPKGSTIDTDLGVVHGPTGLVISVQTEMVGSIRVFVAKSFALDDLALSGSAPVALVAASTISIAGVVNLSANKTVGGPGSQASSACAGTDAMETKLGNSIFAQGAGGGGNATAGGAGGGFSSVGAGGGTAQSSFAPLLGGCRGGNLTSNAGVMKASGGAGGGALQIVAGTSVVFDGDGLVSAAGGGGGSPGGGGSGGTIVIESPVVSFDGSGGIATNGGSGGCSASAGINGGADLAPAHASGCGTTTDGDGGTAMSAAKAGADCNSTCPVQGDLQAGGGAAGRTRIATRTGELEMSGIPLLSTALTLEKL